MRKLINYIKKNIQLVYRVLSFIASAIILIFLFPREGHFPYEFQKGKIWLNPDLYSTFDFPIRKTEGEIKKDKDSILKDFKPYFNFIKNTEIEQLKKLGKTFGSQWTNFAEERTSQNTSPEIKSFYKDADSVTKSIYLKFANDLLSYVYNKGIVQIPDNMDQNPSRDFTIVIIKDNVGQEYMYSDIFSQKAAYEYVLKKINDLKQGSLFDKIIYESGFFKELNLNQFLLPNLIYNEEASRNVKEDLIKRISLTNGLFRADQKIIGKGELVTLEKYNLLLSLKYEYETKLGKSSKISYIILGQSIIIISLLLLLIIYIINFRREVYANNVKFSFILLLVTLIVAISSLITRSDQLNLYMVPFTLLPIIIKTFYDARLALVVHTVVILMVGFLAPNAFEFIFLNFATGTVSIISLTNTYRRGKLIDTSFYVFLSYCILYFGMFLLQGNDLSKITQPSYLNTLLSFSISGFLVLMAYPLIFIFEKMFGFLSDITLMELSDTNQPLLRMLNEKTPGTFQHSLQVANLAEEAAFKIGANPLLVRTGALYHDIGKMVNPKYFIENLSLEKNPHLDLSNEESAKIIMEHVTKGIDIAKKYHLPEQITDYIRTHHGTSTVQFFYMTSKNQNPEIEIDKSKFTYPGPIPFSKEMALVMMADSVEAASRSIKDISYTSINDLVENIIYYQMINEQYNNSNITYKDQSIVKEIFKRKLMNIYHVRVEYPE